MITTLLLDTDLAIVAAVTSTNVAEALHVLDGKLLENSPRTMQAARIDAYLTKIPLLESPRLGFGPVFPQGVEHCALRRPRSRPTTVASSTCRRLETARREHIAKEYDVAPAQIDAG
jgi:hypothetical protein